MSRHPTQRVEPGSVAQPHTRQLESIDVSSIEEAIYVRSGRARSVPARTIQARRLSRRGTGVTERVCFRLVPNGKAVSAQFTAEGALTGRLGHERQQSVTSGPSRGTRGARGRP